MRSHAVLKAENHEENYNEIGWSLVRGAILNPSEFALVVFPTAYRKHA